MKVICLRAAVLAAAFAVLIPAQQPTPAGAAQARKDSCVECHSLLEDNLGNPVQLFKDDIHNQYGFSCADCHGGDPSSDDPEISMSPARGFLGKISRRQTPELCGGCHGDAALIHRFKPQQRVDQLAQYRTSVHGKRLAEGDLKVANCIDCHSVHDVREVRHALSPIHPLKLPETCAHCHADADRMEEYGIPTDQFDDYRKSVHWQALAERGDLSAPSCATCHGNHGATPPGIASVSNVCGTCHVFFQELFDKSPHKTAFEAMGLAACVVCHGNHEVSRTTPEMLGVSEGAVCIDCHAEGEAAYDVAAAMKERVDELRRALDQAEEILSDAEQFGMEVSEGQLQWNAAHEEWIKARVQVHSFQLEPLDAAVQEGLQLAQTSYQAGAEALEEKDFRRKGLALSLVTIVLAIAGLWLAVRLLEKNSEGRPSGQDLHS